MYSLKIKKLDHFPEDKDIVLPREGDVGIDIFAAEDVFLCNNTTTRVKTGACIKVPSGFWLLLKDRSSKALYYEVNAGVIDSSYTGEVLVSLRTTNGEQLNSFKDTHGARIVGSGLSGYRIKKGDKIAQAIIMKDWNNTFTIDNVDELESTTRGTNGFGSTGN